MFKSIVLILFLNIFIYQIGFAQSVLRGFVNSENEQILLIKLDNGDVRYFWKPKFNEFEGFSELHDKHPGRVNPLKEVGIEIPFISQTSGDDSFSITLQRDHVVVKALGVNDRNKMGPVTDFYAAMGAEQLSGIEQEVKSGTVKLRSIGDVSQYVDNLLVLQPLSDTSMDQIEISIQRELKDPTRLFLEVFLPPALNVDPSTAKLTHRFLLQEIPSQNTTRFQQAVESLKTMWEKQSTRQFRTNDGTVIVVTTDTQGNFLKIKSGGSAGQKIATLFPSLEFVVSFANSPGRSTVPFDLTFSPKKSGQIARKDWRSRLIRNDLSVPYTVIDPVTGKRLVRFSKVPNFEANAVTISTPADAAQWRRPADRVLINQGKPAMTPSQCLRAVGG